MRISRFGQSSECPRSESRNCLQQIAACFAFASHSIAQFKLSFHCVPRHSIRISGVRRSLNRRAGERDPPHDPFMPDSGSPACTASQNPPYLGLWHQLPRRGTHPSSYTTATDRLCRSTSRSPYSRRTPAPRENPDAPRPAESNTPATNTRRLPSATPCRSCPKPTPRLRPRCRCRADRRSCAEFSISHCARAAPTRPTKPTQNSNGQRPSAS